MSKLGSRYIPGVLLLLGFLAAPASQARDYQIGIDAIDATKAGQPVTFGMVFPEGELPYSNTLSATIDVGGSPSPLQIQMDKKASHCADGALEFAPKDACGASERSVRHAIISTVLPKAIPQGQRARITLRPTGGDGGGGGSIDFPSSLALRTVLTMDGVNWEADLATVPRGSLSGSLPMAGTTNAAVSEWLSGAVAREWTVRVRFVDASDSSKVHPHLVARYNIRHYPEADNTKVDVVVENNWSFVPLVQSFGYQARVYINDELRYEDAALNHFVKARWKITLWEKQYPELQVIQDPAQLISSRAVPNYSESLIGNVSGNVRSDYDKTWASVRPEVSGNVLRFKNKITYCMKSADSPYIKPCSDPGVFPVVTNKAGPMGIGEIPTPYMSQTGARQEIAPLPRWAAAYVLEQRYSYYKMMMTIADGAASWPIHLRDQGSDMPLSLLDHPNVRLRGRQSYGIQACQTSASCLNPFRPDDSHQPAFAVVPYIVSGDYFYLEEMQFWASYNAAIRNQAARGGDRGLMEYDAQTRAMGWSLRTMAQTAYLTPDRHDLKPFYLHMLKSNIDDFTTIYVSDPSQSNSYGMVTPGAGNHPVASPWMQDYVGWAFGYISNLGYRSALPMSRWKAKFAVKRMGFDDSGYCWIFGGNYHLFVGPNAEARPPSGQVPTVTVRNALGSGNTKPKLHFASIDDVWEQSNAATNGGYNMLGGGVINTREACGSSAQAAELGLAEGQMVYDTGASALVAQMGIALAAAVDVGATEAVPAWNRYANRAKRPSPNGKPEWAIVPIALNDSGGSSTLPDNSYDAGDGSASAPGAPEVLECRVRP